MIIHSRVIRANVFYSLDNLANNIAAATFGVINEGTVRTAEMGGTQHCTTVVIRANHRLSGSATTSDFTAAVIKKL